eukprot:4542013-Pyramimonas_sp.AAC.1
MRLPAHVRGYGMGCRQQAGGQHQRPAPPPPVWDQHDRLFRQHQLSDRARVGGDRGASKVWVIKHPEFGLSAFEAVVQDPQWAMRRDLTVANVDQWGYAKAFLALPGFLRRPAGRPGRPLGPPRLCPLIKSNCHADDGHLTCTKPGHSHWKRILDMSGTPFAAGWKVAARGARSAVEVAGESRELFDMSCARQHMQHTFPGLRIGSRPAACQKRKKSK